MIIHKLVLADGPIKLPICSTILTVKFQKMTPVLWFQHPDYDRLNYDALAWPSVELIVQLVPTGKPAPSGYKYIGTIMRKQRSDSKKNAVFHAYIENTEFINFK